MCGRSRFATIDAAWHNRIREAYGMDGRQSMRASDHDRQEVVSLLRTGLEDGRLTMEEYVDRAGLAYQAVTYADLVPLHADLPAAPSGRAGSGAAGQQATPPAGARPAAGTRRGVLAGLPTVLRVLWTVWLAVVSINVVVWALVCGTTGHLVYPWPAWVAGPYGAALFAVSVGVTQLRRSRMPLSR
jgi:hypothetical protein